MVKTKINKYTLKSGREVKELVVKPDTENGLFKYKDIVSYVNKNLKNIGKDKRVVVRGLNILGDRTLDTFNTTLKKQNESELMNDSDYDDYLNSKVKDPSKFKYFHSFYISISTDPIDDMGFMFSD